MSRNLAWRGAAIGLLSVLGGLATGGLARGDNLSGGAWIAIALASALICAATGFFALRGAEAAVAYVTTAAARLGDPAMSASADGPSLALTPAFNAMSRRVHGLFDDIHAEQARLEAVFNASSDGMVALSNDSTVRFANRAASALFGPSPETIVGRPLIESARDYELDGLVRTVARLRAPVAAVVAFGPSRLPLRVAAVPIAAGGDWSVLLTLTDLTEVNRVDQMRRDFVGNVSHELRTPLASIKALAETLEDGVDGPDETAAFTRRIGQQVDRLAALVNELLDLSRIESGAVELRPESVDLAALAAEAATLLAMRLEQTGVTIALPGTAVTAEADHGAVLRAVSNLFDNAIKYSPRGGQIDVQLADEGDLVALSVRDEGSGIAPADLPRVFERFYKGDASRATAGVGLGLAIVKHIVRQHGGTVDAQSSVGEGATFTIRLPKRFVGRTGARPSG